MSSQQLTRRRVDTSVSSEQNTDQHPNLDPLLSSHNRTPVSTPPGHPDQTTHSNGLLGNAFLAESLAGPGAGGGDGGDDDGAAFGGYLAESAQHTGEPGDAGDGSETTADAGSDPAGSAGSGPSDPTGSPTGASDPGGADPGGADLGASSEGAGAGAGAATAAAIDTTDPGAVLASIQHAPPTQLLPTFTAAGSAGAQALANQRQGVVDTLPKVPTPTGLAPIGGEASGTEVETKAASEDVTLAEGQGPDPVPEARPVPEAPALRQPQVAIEGGGEGEEGGDAALARSANNALAAVTFAPVPTTDPDQPRLQLTGAADPARMEDARAQGDARVHTAALDAAGAVRADFGEARIAPEPDAEILEASASLSEVGEAGAAEVPGLTGALPPEMAAGVDLSAGPLLDAKIGEQTGRYHEGQAKFETDAAAARAESDQKIQDEIAATTEAQTGHRDGAVGEVDRAKADWQSEIDQIQSSASTDADRARTSQLAEIEREQTTANAEARGHIAAAERKAEAKRADAERRAEAKKQAAEEESQGFWGWLKSKARALIDGLKAAVNAIYDGLRAIVKTIMDAAKKLAVAVIDLAAKAIVGLIRAYGEILKGIVRVALAAFPRLADEMTRRIDAAVAGAEAAVNAAASALKTAVSAIIDFLAKTLDQLLSLVQSLYNAAFTLIGMIVSGEWKAILDGLANLVGAAMLVPSKFEAAAYEELLGGDMEKPLSPAELSLAGIAPPGGGAGAGGGEAGVPGPPWSADNVGVDNVVSDLQLSESLQQEILAATGGDGELTFGESNDPERSMSAILGTDAGVGQGVGPAGPAVVPDDGLSVRERASARWTIMKKGLSDWWSKNWPLVIGGGVLAIGGFIAANILSGGAVLAALPAVMSVLGPLFIGMAVAMVGEHVAAYISQGWAGNKPAAGKSLAKALAIGAVELIGYLTFKASGAILKGAKAAARGAKAAAKGAVGAVRRGAGYVMKQGKVLLRGLDGSGFGRAFSRVSDFGAGLLRRTKFKGFRIRVRNRRRFQLQGKINPWVTIAEGRVTEVDGPSPGAMQVDDVAKFEKDFEYLRSTRQGPNETPKQWRERLDGMNPADDDELKLLMERMDRADKQGVIDAGTRQSTDAWNARKGEVWANENLSDDLMKRLTGSGDGQLDDFWRRVDGADTLDDVAKAKEDLLALRNEIAGSRRANKAGLLKDVEERLSKIDHRKRMIEARSAGTRQTGDIVEDITSNGGKTDHWASSRDQALDVQDATQAKLNQQGSYDPTDFHGPETHRGSRVDDWDNPNLAPDDPHVNLKGTLDGESFTTHLYHPDAPR